MKFDLSTDFGKQSAQEHLDHLKSKGKPCEVKEIRKTRSKRANSYYWSIVSYIGLKIGYSKDEMHDLCKQGFGETYEKHGRTFLTSTAEFKSDVMAKYIDWIRNMAMKHHDIYVPSGEEYVQGAHIEIDNFIEQNKQYL